MQNRKFYISLMIGAICVVAAAAVFLNSYDGDDGSFDDGTGMVAEAVTPTPKVETAKRIAVKHILPSAEPVVTSEPSVTETAESTMAPVISTDAPENKTADNTKKNGKKKKAGSKSKKDDKAKTVAKTGTDITSLSFDQEAGILWPVTGDVIMNYSPDNVVLYKTLGQYKNNPAIVISSEKGAKVCSAADAVVTKVGNNEEIGNYVVTSIGDDYKIMYGQLENIAVKKGDTLKEGEIIGSIAEPTKYYSEEGSNLYMKMTCKKEPVDPMIFLR